MDDREAFWEKVENSAAFRLAYERAGEDITSPKNDISSPKNIILSSKDDIDRFVEAL